MKSRKQWLCALAQRANRRPKLPFCDKGSHRSHVNSLGSVVVVPFDLRVRPWAISFGCRIWQYFPMARSGTRVARATVMKYSDRRCLIKTTDFAWFIDDFGFKENLVNFKMENDSRATLELKGFPCRNTTHGRTEANLSFTWEMNKCAAYSNQPGNRMWRRIIAKTGESQWRSESLVESPNMHLNEVDARAHAALGQNSKSRLNGKRQIEERTTTAKYV